MPPHPYQPTPLDTSGVTLTPEIELLLERLAENVHDLWSKKRLEDGWCFGPERSDPLKTNPCLVPYEALPDFEKEYDRSTAAETLRGIIALGYSIERKPGRLDPGMRESLRARLTEELKKPGEVSSSKLWKLCAGLSGVDLGESLLLRLAARALHDGELWICGEVLARGAGRDDKDSEPDTDPALELQNFRQTFRINPRARLLRARWLAQTGNFMAARRILSDLRSSGWNDGETLGLLGRTHKDEWEWARRERMRSCGGERQTESPAAELIFKRESQALEACRLAYVEAFAAAPDDYYPGINAATMSLLVGHVEEAERLAGEVIKLCEQDIVRNGRNAWNVPSLAEAHAVLADQEKAAGLYSEAARHPAAGLRDVCTMRKQARLIAAHHGWGRHELDGCFGLPPVVVYSGHRIDQDPERPRFPAGLEAQVAEEIQLKLAAIRAQTQNRFGLIAYGSAAAGADILFGEELMSAKGDCARAELHLVLSSPADGFVKSEVNYAGAEWEKRCYNLIAAASETAVANPHQPVSNSLTYSYVEEVMVGMAQMKADFLALDLVPIAVWDGEPGDGPGGTADFVAFWQNAGIVPLIIEPALPAGSGVKRRFTPGLKRKNRGQQIMGILFADVKNFSRLSEEQVPMFVESFMGEVSKVVAHSAHQPAVLNTWGDALYMVFDKVEDAGMLSLELQQALCPEPHGRARWSDLGLPAELTVRFGLHAGPVFSVADPVVRHLSYTGRHTTLAARLEPVTPPGQIFVSQEFAALAHLQGCRGFSCVYLGRLDLAKSYGQDLPVYQLSRRE